jgi:hypothetical protein
VRLLLVELLNEDLLDYFLDFVLEEGVIIRVLLGEVEVGGLLQILL